MIFQVNNYQGATTYRDYQAGPLSLVSGGQLATLAVNGASITFSFNFIEQVSAGVSFADFVVDNGETYTREWRTSTDGSAWTAWATLNSAAVAAFTATANNKLYIEVRYTRTSAGAPPIVVYGLVFRFTYNPSATSGRGYIEDTNVINDLTQLFQGMAESATILRSGSPAFNVEMKPPTISTKGNKPIIGVHDIQLAPQSNAGCNRWRTDGRLRIFVKKLANGNQQDADRQFSQILAAFSASRWYESTYDFTYKGDVYVSATAQFFGLMAISSQTTTEYTDTATNDHYREMMVIFSFEHQKTLTA